MDILKLLPTSEAQRLAVVILKKDEATRLRPYCDKTGVEYVKRVYEVFGELCFTDATADWNRISEHLKSFGITPLGKMTVLTGLNLEARSLSMEANDVQLYMDILENERQVRGWLGTYKHPGKRVWTGNLRTEWSYHFDELSPLRQAVLLALGHWGGITKASQFRAWTLRALSPQFNDPQIAWDDAAEELLYKDGGDPSKGRSGWWNISESRVTRYSEMWQSGELHKHYQEESDA